jgi:phosphoribosylformylglycinamidine (FGAM) synthase PurS component
MVKITVTLEEEEHLKLLELQLQRKKDKKEPTAINKIASEILTNALKKENPTE